MDIFKRLKSKSNSPDTGGIVKMNVKLLLFLLPSLLGFMLFYVVPFFWGFTYALYDSPIHGKFIGLQNFIALMSNRSFLLALANTIKFICLCVPLNLIIPLVFAMMLNRCVKGKGIFQALFLSPLVIPAATVAMFWQIFFDNQGSLNAILNFLHIPTIDFLKSPLAMIAIVLVYMWKNMGYNMVIYSATLNGIPKNYYEAVALEGASGIKIFFYVTLPSIAPTLFFVFVISIINCFKVFKEVYLLAGQYPNENIYMLQHFMNNMFTNLNYQKLTSAAYIMAFLIISVIFFLFKMERKMYENY